MLLTSVFPRHERSPGRPAAQLERVLAVGPVSPFFLFFLFVVLAAA